MTTEFPQNDPETLALTAYQIGNEKYGTYLFTVDDVMKSLNSVVNECHPLEATATLMMFDHMKMILDTDPEKFVEMTSTELMEMQSRLTQLIFQFITTEVNFISADDLEKKGKDVG